MEAPWQVQKAVERFAVGTNSVADEALVAAWLDRYVVEISTDKWETIR